ncbi:LAMI_0H17326g1_1 [Lachancea mirantina]|uniref:LAMI_0H17326g1_1 n=1 Tax=Lachancea mirantina TaxID=1230905 RepID=A0A1G4KJN6_9SACH|nr:LAMI_0H17326g1_1 [Lachancea mirantina]
MGDINTNYNETEDESIVGYISIKDFAYDQSNPLHFGFFDSVSEEGDGDSDDRETKEEDINKRQSIILPTDYIINHKAVALFDFSPENDNELELKEGDVVYISYRHGQGWLVAENTGRTKTGLVPEEYVSFLEDDEDDDDNGPEEPRPFYLTRMLAQNMGAKLGNAGDDDEWEDIHDVETEVADKLKI